MKSGVTTAWFHWMGVGRSTRIPRLSSSDTRRSSSALAFSTVSRGRGPHIPRMSLSSGIFASVAGSDGGMQVKSARPTMTCSSGSKSFHELTTVLLIPVVPPVERHPCSEAWRECARKRGTHAHAARLAPNADPGACPVGQIGPGRRPVPTPDRRCRNVESRQRPCALRTVRASARSRLSARGGGLPDCTSGLIDSRERRPRRRRCHALRSVRSRTLPRYDTH